MLIHKENDVIASVSPSRGKKYKRRKRSGLHSGSIAAHGVLL